MMMIVFWILFGLAGAISFLALARTQSNQESPILAVGLVVAALIYICFAIAGGATKIWILIEVAGVGVYGLLAVLGLRYSNWWLMLGWMTHPLWDIGLHLFNKGAAFTPVWYAITCVSFDLVLAIYITGVQYVDFNLRKPDMNPELKFQWLLKILLITSIISTAIHFADNYLFIEQYPQPDWITAPSIYQSWLILTALGITGYWLYKSQKFWLAYGCLLIYSLTGLASPGHYLYGSISQFSVKMHILIWADGLSGLAILGFIIWSALILKQWRREPSPTDNTQS